MQLTENNTADGKCPCCSNPWQAATAGFFCQICDEETKEPEKSTSVRGLDRSNMDMTVEPNDNFYVYSNGNWMKKNPIPSGYSSWNTFQVSDDDNDERYYVYCGCWGGDLQQFLGEVVY